MRINPREDVTLAPGQNYTVAVVTAVDTGSLIENPSITDPKLEVNVSGTGDASPEITGIVSSERAYGERHDQLSTDNFTLVGEELYAGSVHRTMVRIHVPEEADTITVEARAGRSGSYDNTANSRANQTYTVSRAENRTEEIARLAESRSRTAEDLAEKYDTLINGRSVEEIVDRGMQQTFIQSGLFVKDVYSLSFTGSKLSTATGAKSIVTQFDDYYESTQTEEKFDGPWVGPIIQAENRMLQEGLQQKQMTRVERAGRTGYALEKLAQLSEEEATAWRNGNRDRAVKLLKKQHELVTIEKDIHPDTILKDKDGNHFQPGEFRLPQEAYDQRQAVDYNRNELTLFTTPYFKGVEQYASETASAIGTVALPLARPPKLRVGLENKEHVERHMSSSGTFNATFAVTNGARAGATSREAYLSVVASNETLSIKDVTQVDDRSDAELPGTNVATGDDPVFTHDGDRESIDGTLLDINEQYDPGETNVYNVTLQRNENTDQQATLTYRAAFQPAIHDGNDQSEFVRRPTDDMSGVERGVQGWYVYNVSGDSTPPEAAIAVNKESPSAGEQVTFDASASTDDTGIRSYAWDLDDDGDYERYGRNVTKTYSESGNQGARVKVTDVGGNVDRGGVELDVKPGVDLVVSDLQVNRTAAFRDQPVRVTATVTNEGTKASDYGFRPLFDGQGPAKFTFDERIEEGGLAPGETAQLNFTGRVGSAGTWKLKIDDYLHRTTIPDPVTVDVQAKPVVRIDRTPNHATVGEEVTASIANSTDPDGAIDSWEWDLDNDGTFEESGTEQTWTASEPGVETYRVRLTDDDGHSVTRTRQFAVHRPSDWPTAGRENGRSASTDAVMGPKSDVEVAWEKKLNESLTISDSLQGTPIVVNDTVYAGIELGSNGRVSAFDKQTGETRWTKSIQPEVTGSPVTWGDTLIVPVENGTPAEESLVTFDRHTGERLWQQTNASGSPAIVNGTAYTPSGDAVDVDTGEMVWSTGRTADGVAVSDSRVFLPIGSRLVALRASNGSVAWDRRNVQTGFAAPAVADGTLFTGDGRVRALDAATGETRWQRAIGGRNTSQEVSPALANGTVYFSTHNDSRAVGGRLVALNASTGDEEWTATYPHWGESAPIVVNGTVYVGSNACEEVCDTTYYPDGIVWAFDAETGEEYWTFRVDEHLRSAPSASDGKLYVGNGMGTLRALGGDTTPPDNSPPDAALSANATNVTVRTPIRFTGESSSDPDGDSLAYEWDFDGDDAVDATGETVTRAFDASGNYTVSLTVSDGEATADDTVAISVANATNESGGATDEGNESGGNESGGSTDDGETGGLTPTIPSGGGGTIDPVPDEDPSTSNASNESEANATTGPKNGSITIVEVTPETTSLSPDETVGVSVTVERTARTTEAAQLNLTTDGRRLDAASVAFSSNESRTAELTATFDEPGTYPLTVDGSEAATITVEQQGEESRNGTATHNGTEAGNGTGSENETAAGNETEPANVSGTQNGTAVRNGTSAENGTEATNESDAAQPDSVPGFGVVPALVAFLVLAIGARRRTS
ncbi:PQQ-binding-like beta-propeller repeat protein [Natronoarchaeum mannanilyticum]|uniref:outer membrane protein assembly factor BamB family protein n=1 Tax=Natronoarchaeum mannanilyticum TaxID=926360 RepID=UPI0031CF0BF0